MNKLELMKTANEIRKGIVTALHSAKAGHPGGKRCIRFSWKNKAEETFIN